MTQTPKWSLESCATNSPTTWAAIKRGAQLGNPEQAKANRLEAEAHAERLPPVLTDLRDLPSRAIAAELTKRAIPTPRGGDWQSTTVMRLLRRLELR